MRWLVLWSCSSCNRECMVLGKCRTRGHWISVPGGALSRSPGLHWGLTWQYRWTAPAPGEWWRACSGGQQGRCHWFSLHQSWCSLHTTPPGGRGPCPERTSLISQKIGKSHSIGKFWGTCLLRNLYAGQEATVRTGHGPTDWFQIGKGPWCTPFPIWN